MDLDDPNNVTETLQSNYKNQNVVFIKTDVTKKEQVKSAFNEVISNFNFIDFVVANAGVLRENDYELTINVNLVIQDTNGFTFHKTNIENINNSSDLLTHFTLLSM